MTKSQMFKAAHADAKRAMAEQKEIKHPSGWRTYAAIFASCLRGVYILEAGKSYAPVQEVKFMFLRGM